MEAIASRLEAVIIRLEAIATKVEAIPIRVEAIASRLDCFTYKLIKKYVLCFFCFFDRPDPWLAQTGYFCLWMPLGFWACSISVVFILENASSVYWSWTQPPHYYTPECFLKASKETKLPAW